VPYATLLQENKAMLHAGWWICKDQFSSHIYKRFLLAVKLKEEGKAERFEEGFNGELYWLWMRRNSAPHRFLKVKQNTDTNYPRYWEYISLKVKNSTLIWIIRSKRILDLNNRNKTCVFLNGLVLLKIYIFRCTMYSTCTFAGEDRDCGELVSDDDN